MEFDAYGNTKPGTKYFENEDALVLDPAHNLYIICDGMGGHAAGKVASKLACEVVAEYVRSHFQDLVSSKEETQAGLACRLVDAAIVSACQKIYTRSLEDSECRGMGTTISMVLIHGNRAVIGHVGDSRVYLMRSGVLSQISHDHTLVQEMIDRGLMPLAARRTSPFAHVLSRCLGAHESVQIDVMQLDLLPGDKLLLCSDGLSDLLEDNAIAARLVDDDMPGTVARVIEQAEKMGGDDDKTAIMIEVRASAAPSAEEREHIEQVTLTMDVLKRIYLFEDMLPEELLQVVERCRVVNCRMGEMLLREGEVGDSLYIILKGFFEVTSAGKTLSGLGERNHFGEMALLLPGTPRSANVFALSEATLLELRAEDFNALVLSNPRIGVKLYSALGRELSVRLKTMNQFNVT